MGRVTVDGAGQRIAVQATSSATPWLLPLLLLLLLTDVVAHAVLRVRHRRPRPGAADAGDPGAASRCGR